MLKRAFALSDKGAKDLKKGIAAATLYNICLMIPVGFLMLVILDMLDKILGKDSALNENIILYCAITVGLFILVFATQ